MNADPAPSAVEPSALEVLAKLIPLCNYWNGEGGPLIRAKMMNAHEQISAELAALRAENGRLAAERDELANWIKRIRGQAESAMASLHGEKLEVDLEVTPPTAK